MGTGHCRAQKDLGRIWGDEPRDLMWVRAGVCARAVLLAKELLPF